MRGTRVLIDGDNVENWIQVDQKIVECQMIV